MDAQDGRMNREPVPKSCIFRKSMENPTEGTEHG